MSATAEDGGIERLAYELSQRALTRQEEMMNELRARTGTLLAASALVASFLGGRVAEAGGGTSTALALAAFVGSVLASVYVLLPKPSLIFALRGSVLFESEHDDPGGLPETHRRLAYWLEGYYDDNQVTVEKMFRLYRVATVAVLLQVLLWVSELGF